MTIASDYSLGVSAPAFPRDPLDVNVFLEHVLIGQTLEPLFTLGDDGLPKGAIADTWIFNKDHTEITIMVRPGLIFSNGKLVNSEDIKYSLERHINNPNSQSYNYLRVIKSIDIQDSDKIKITLHHKYVPFLLTLTRDQLGVVPKGWQFNATNLEPYIGTGPYKIIKENGIWNLVANPKYRNPKEVDIKHWRLDLLDTAKNLFPSNPSDLILLVPKPVKEKLIKKYPNFEMNRNETKSFSFVQYSFWWLKDNYSQYTIEQKKQINNALTILSESVVQFIGGNLSSGIIPSGIMGALDKRPMLLKSENLSKIEIKITVPQVLTDIINEQIVNNQQLKATLVSINIVPYTLLEVSKIKDSNCNLALVSYAGGFFDPEGYLTVLPSILGKTTYQLFGEKSETLRLKAEREFDGQVRSELYKKFSKTAQEEIRYIPGWVPHFSEFRNEKITKKPGAFKYSYKLLDYKAK